MAIDYDFYSSKNLRNAQGELYVRPIVNQVKTTEDLADQIEHMTTASRSDIRLVLDALSRELAWELLQGNSVRIDGLGTFSITMQGDIDRDSIGRLLLRNAAVRSVRFRPGQELMRELSRAEFTSAYHRGRHSTEVTEEEVRAAVVQLTEGGDVFSSRQFRHSLGLTASTARKHLLRLQEEGVVRNVGGRNCAVWAAAQDA